MSTLFVLLLCHKSIVYCAAFITDYLESAKYYRNENSRVHMRGARLSFQELTWFVCLSVYLFICLFASLLACSLAHLFTLKLQGRS